MFDFLKDVNKLRQMQSAAKEETATVEKNGVKVTVNGAFEVLSIEPNTELDSATLSNTIRDCTNDALKQVQKSVAQKLYSQQ